MIKKSLLLSLVFIFSSTTPAFAEIDVDIQTMNASKAATRAGNGERGPALAVLKNGNLILGGGNNGGTLFLGDGKKRAVITLGDLIKQSDRKKDSRFAITDIAVLSEGSNSAKLLVSYPRLGAGKKCVEVVVDQVDANFTTNKIVKNKTWFVSKPCVPIKAVQHAAGRMEKIDANSVYLTIGDLGFTKINDVQARGDLGSVFQLTETSVKKISTGHRNAQGIVLLANKTLLVSEHGPRGGDEINVIKTQQLAQLGVTNQMNDPNLNEIQTKIFNLDLNNDLEVNHINISNDLISVSDNSLDENSDSESDSDLDYGYDDYDDFYSDEENNE